MSPLISRNATVFLFVFLAGFAPAARGQGGSGDPTQSLYNAYWSTANGFQSLAQLHNNLISAPLTVTPILYDANGWSLPLDNINLPPLGNATINIADQLAAKGWTGAPTGSMVFQYNRRSAGALSAELYVEKEQDSLSFTIPSAERPPASAIQNAVLWIPSRDAEVYVALQNVSGVAINVSSTLTMYGQTVPLPSAQLPPHGFAVMDISKDAGIGVLASAWQKDAVGGITVTQDGPPGALNTGGWIADDHLGYSTTMTFQDPTVGTGRLVSTQILVGPAQALLNLPGPFTISSQLVLRNVSNQPLDFQGQLVFSDNTGNLFNAQIQPTHLIAGEVRGIDLNQVKTQAGIPESVVSASIALQHSGSAGALMGRVYGVSADKSYGFYWALQPSAGNSYSESFWTTAGSWTPILTVANVAAVPDTVTVQLTSNNGTFTLAPFPLQPLESRTINVRDLTSSGATDKDGKSLPVSTDFGGYRISGALRTSQLVIKEHLIDPESKLSTPFYGVYAYVLSLYFDPSSYSVATGYDVAGVNTWLLWSDDPNHIDPACPNSGDNTVPYYFYPGNTNIASVTPNGCLGNVTGNQVGTVSLYAHQSGVTIDNQGDTGPVDTQQPAQITVVQSPCFAMLKFRPSRYWGFNHAFWWIQTSASTHYTIDGGPGGSWPNYLNLNDWVVFGDVGHFSLDVPSAATDWDSGTSGAVCPAVNALYTYALGWPQNSIGYNPFTSNSNTFAHYAANAAGFTPPAPPNAPGW